MSLIGKMVQYNKNIEDIVLRERLNQFVNESFNNNVVYQKRS